MPFRPLEIVSGRLTPQARWRSLQRNESLLGMNAVCVKKPNRASKNVTRGLSPRNRKMLPAMAQEVSGHSTREKNRRRAQSEALRSGDSRHGVRGLRPPGLRVNAIARIPGGNQNRRPEKTRGGARLRRSSALSPSPIRRTWLWNLRRKPTHSAARHQLQFAPALRLNVIPSPHRPAPKRSKEEGSGAAPVAFRVTLSSPLVLSFEGSPLRNSIVVDEPSAVNM
jgi:hypothetical protein